MKAPNAIHLYECPNCGHVTDLRTIRTRMAKVLGSLGGRATGPAKSHPLSSEAARQLALAKKRKAAVRPFAKRKNPKALAADKA